MNWIQVGLTDISNPKQWKQLSTSELTEIGCDVYGANGIIGKYSEFNHELPTLAITCRGATCGSMHITKPKSYITGNAMALDSLIPSVDMKFLYYALKKRGFNDIISGSAQPQITRQGLSKVTVEIPEKLEDQIRIATLLSKAEALIKQRKESIDLLDEYLKSTFLEMFGDPFLNQKKHNIVSIDQIVKNEKNAIVDGPFGSSLKDSDYVENGIPIIRINNIRDNGFYNSAFKYIREEKYNELIRSKVEFNDLLIARVGNTIGKTCIYNQRQKMLLSTTGVAKATIDPLKANLKYISTQLRLPQYIKYIWDQTEGGGQPYLNLKKIRNFRILLPPLKEQNLFGLIVEKTESLKAQYKSSLTELENLYGSLSQKAFKGELNLEKGEEMLMAAEPVVGYGK